MHFILSQDASQDPNDLQGECRKYPAEQPTAYLRLEVREGPTYLPSPTTNHNPLFITQQPTDEPTSSRLAYLAANLDVPERPGRPQTRRSA